MPEVKHINYQLLPKQMQFVNSTAKQTLFSGAWGASKSTALCLSVLKESVIPGAQILLCRKTYTSLKRTTLQTLLYGDNPIIPNGSYKLNKIDQTIKLNGLNSTIYMSGLEDILKIRSMNLSMVAIDEASELTENEWIELQGRLRDTHGSRRIIAATNPASPSHFLYRKFFVNKGKNKEVICATTLENRFLPPDYIESLKELPKNMYDKFVLGAWIENENQIYKEWNRDTCIKQRDISEFHKFVLGVDFGFTNPCAIVLIGVDGDNNLHLLEELKESKLLIGQIVNKCEKYRKLEPEVICDPSSPALIAQFEEAGFNAVGANNSIDDGLARLQNYLHLNKFSVDSKCEEWIKEVENYCYSEKGKPVKIHDHLMDATRYVVNHVIELVQEHQPLIVLGDDKEEDDFNMALDRYNNHKLV